jgi:hypothetical protein
VERLEQHYYEQEGITEKKKHYNWR